MTREKIRKEIRGLKTARALALFGAVLAIIGCIITRERAVYVWGCLILALAFVAVVLYSANGISQLRAQANALHRQRGA